MSDFEAIPKINTKSNIQCSTTLFGPTGRASIHKLPKEIFTAILLLIRDSGIDPADGSGTEDNCGVWMKLNGVCRLWRSVILGTPAMWTHITIRKNVDMFRLFVERSREHVVDVHFENFNFPFRSCQSSATHMEIARAIVDISYRIRHLMLFTMDEDAMDYIVLRLPSSMPILEKLCLRPIDGITASLNLGVAPRLYDLSITSMAISPASCALHCDLVTLDLQDIMAPFPVHSLLGLLANSPRLETLCLRRTSLSLPALQLPSLVNTPPVELPCLQTLLVEEAANILGYLPSRISFPTTAFLEFCLAPSEDDVEPQAALMPSDVLPEANSLSSYIKDAVSLYIRCDCHIFDVTSRHGGVPSRADFSLRVELCQRVGDTCLLLPRAMADMAHKFAGSPVNIIDIVGRCNVLDAYDWIMFLHAFPHLWGLDVRQRDHSPLLIALGSYDEHSAPRCPYLRFLKLSDCELSDQVIHALIMMLEVRAALGVPIQILLLIQYEQRSQECRFSEEQVEKIVDLVGVKFRCTDDMLPSPLPRCLEHIVPKKRYS